VTHDPRTIRITVLSKLSAAIGKFTIGIDELSRNLVVSHRPQRYIRLNHEKDDAGSRLRAMINARRKLRQSTMRAPPLGRCPSASRAIRLQQLRLDDGSTSGRLADTELVVAGIKYVIAETLGQGGTSYVVSDTAPDGSKVALKIYNVFIASNLEVPRPAICQTRY
jgi:hypothetical protein